MSIRFFVPLALALSTPVLAADPPPPCNSSERSHDFDFWIGEWDVYAGDQLAGTNSIRPLMDGCVLQEQWKGAKGSEGTSFNFYDPQRKAWRQVWVWRQGSTLELEGKLDGRAMVLSGSSKQANGADVLNRITWTPNADGSVRQHWQTSGDGGVTWADSFDGRYVRRANTDAEAIRAAVLDYANSAYLVQPELIDRSVHPKLQKVGYIKRADAPTHREAFMNFDQLRDLVSKWNKEGRFDAATARRDIRVIDQLDVTAVARLDAEWGVDYFHLAKIEGQWKIVNVIWQTVP